MYHTMHFKTIFFGARSKHIKISSDSYPYPKVILDVAETTVFFHLTLHRSDGGRVPLQTSSETS